MDRQTSVIPRLNKWNWLRQGGVMLFGLWLMWAMFKQLGQVDLHLVEDALRGITAPRWGLAVVATAISFMAISRYDGIIISLLGLNIPKKTSFQAGFFATAIAQAAGFGFLTGGMVRWRLYGQHGVSFLRAVQITGLVALGFLSALAVISAGSLLLVDVAPQYDLIAGGILCIFAVILVLAVVRPTKLTKMLPPLPAIGVLLWLTLVDTSTAAAALWIFLPEDAGVSFPQLYAIYLVALAGALICGTPLGFGPFELTILALLPHIEVELLLASLAAFRGVYYGLPLLVSGYFLLFQARTSTTRRPNLKLLSKNAISTQIANARRADANLFRQGDKHHVYNSTQTSALMTKISGNSLVGLSDPLGNITEWPSALQALSKHAKNNLVFPCIYKASAPLANVARRRGWVAMRIGAEAIINPSTFTLCGSNKRELRRKISKASKGDVQVSLVSEIATLNDVSNAWVSSHQGERQFSMGIFCPEYLKTQQMLGAFLHGECIGFVTLFETKHEISIDLLRINANAPDGTAHLLVHNAIQMAAKEGRERFSLCAAPFHLATPPECMLEHVLIKVKNHVQTENGLYRFKNSFRPKWENQYLVSKNYAMLFATIPDIANVIRPASKTGPEIPEPAKYYR